MIKLYTIVHALCMHARALHSLFDANWPALFCWYVLKNKHGITDVCHAALQNAV
jgi:hypothetical protein